MLEGMDGLSIDKNLDLILLAFYLKINPTAPLENGSARPDILISTTERSVQKNFLSLGSFETEETISQHKTRC